MSPPDRDRTRWFLRNILPHEPSLRAWLSRNTLPGMDADDVVQESYSILAELESTDAIVFPRAYLFQVARSVIVRQVRRSQIVPIHMMEDIEQLEHWDSAASPEQRVIDRDELLQLARAIAAMPVKTREAFVLRRVQGLSQREIAARLQISENTVETHISRGILFLINWFGRGGNRRSQASTSVKPQSSATDGQGRQQPRH